MQRIHGELDDFARRLAETLVDIAVGVAAERSGLGGQPNPNPEADAIAEKAAALFKVNWGKVLNHYLMDAFRDQRYIASVRPEFDASTYGEVLKRVAESEISFPRSDASEA